MSCVRFADWLVAQGAEELRCLRLCQAAVARLDRPGLRGIDHRWDGGLPEAERLESLEAGRVLEDAMEGALHLGVGGWLVHDRRAGLTPGHFLPLFVARAAAFHLPPGDVACAFLYQRWRRCAEGAGRSGGEEYFLTECLPVAGHSWRRPGRVFPGDTGGVR
jgi:hypothetical protein